MSAVNFSLVKNNSILEISGQEYSLESINKFRNILEQINNEKKSLDLNITGNFNSNLQIKELLKKNNHNEIKKALSLFQLITKNIEESDINFICELNGIVNGPALEIALSCNEIKANTNTIFKFEEIDNGFMPLFGSIQRLIRIIGYKNTLETLLIKKTLNYELAESYKMVNYKSNITNKLYKNNFFWDQDFTNTFIFYNSKIHAKTKNKLPAYNAILSSIFEGSICGYEAALSIEKKWSQWLLNNEDTIKKNN